MKGRLVSATLWLLGLACGAAFLALTAARTDTRVLAAMFASLSWPAVLAAMSAYATGLMLRAWRWRELLRPLRPLGLGRMLRPTLVGHALNNLFPARLGELFRANYARSVCGLRGSALLGTIVVERIIDLALILALMTAGLSAVVGGGAQGPREAIAAGVASLAIAGLGLAVLVAAGRGALLQRVPVLGSRLVGFSQGAASLLKSRSLLVLGLSATVWTCEAVALWLLFRAVGLDLAPAGLGLVLGCGALSTLLPNAPGFVGTLQFALMTATGLLTGDGNAGIAVATLMQIFLYLPTTVAGFAWAAAARESPFEYATLASDPAPEGGISLYTDKRI